MSDTTPGGIVFPLAGDKIKDAASPSALAEDFRKLAFSAEQQSHAAANAAEEAAIDHADMKIDALKTSHISLDTDGVPYYDPGSMAVQVLQDDDGVPYFKQALA